MQLLLLKDDLTEAAPANGRAVRARLRACGGIFADAEKTDAAFIQNPLCPDYRDILYRTGDMAVQREDGISIFLPAATGRSSMGYRIELGEIEALYSVDGLHDAVCFYDAMRDRIVCVYAGDLDTERTCQALRTRCRNICCRTSMKSWTRCRTTPTARLDRAALKERFCACAGLKTIQRFPLHPHSCGAVW